MGCSSQTLLKIEHGIDMCKIRMIGLKLTS